MLIQIFATVYIAFVTTRTDGPWLLWRELRYRFPPTYNPLHCVWCMAFWGALIAHGLTLTARPAMLAWPETWVNVLGFAGAGGTIAWSIGLISDLASPEDAG